MSAGKIIGYIFASILIVIGLLFIIATFSEDGKISYLLTGSILVLIGFGIIWFTGRKKDTEKEEVTMKIDLSGDVDLDTLSCKSCGGHLDSENISMVAGAPVVECPYCGTSYQLTEEPKW
ncbi:MAG: hypothetical protein R6U51_11435 [Anaerolineales bacterium]